MEGSKLLEIIISELDRNKNHEHCLVRSVISCIPGLNALRDEYIKLEAKINDLENKISIKDQLIQKQAETLSNIFSKK